MKKPKYVCNQSVNDKHKALLWNEGSQVSFQSHLCQTQTHKETSKQANTFIFFNARLIRVKIIRQLNVKAKVGENRLKKSMHAVFQSVSQ